MKILAICLCLFLIIDGGLYILYDFDSIGALLKLLGIKSAISVSLRWILIMAAVALRVKYGTIFDYAFRNPGDASIPEKAKNN
ncbi:hypothetical protein lacNasYZ03_03700 [Lactobacillus nasalidis]|uniref:Uncharacterized protein n=1 Tax=Lactobacillus nasalidis TaxID=2797258 RepID=A0ABQ3W2X0_9LACO|nr:hypothetical protein lacNasYZ03_03700 [Lactobacillus nasalidis]